MRTARMSPHQRTRQARLERIPVPEDGCCEHCHRHPDWRGLMKHHIIKRSHGGGDDQENIVWLCGRCHSKEHGLREVI